jgi:hypothetical protein
MIIGISGKLRSGKDTLAAMIMELDKSYQRKAYADKLKVIGSMLSGIPVEKFHDVEFKKEEMPPEWDNQLTGEPMKVREFLQWIGTDALRNNLHVNVWINALMSEYKPEESKWLITDVRFPNEAAAVLDKGGILVRVNRDVSHISTHPSEIALDSYDKWDVVVDNNGTLDDLNNMAMHVLKVANKNLLKQNKDE